MIKQFLRATCGVAFAFGIVGFALYTPAGHAAQAVAIPAPKSDYKSIAPREVAVFAGGCFWGMEAVFESLKGVQSVTSGYAGGTKATANYEEVSSERTGHAEAIRIIYNPAVISYGTLLQVFFSVAHNPTEVNRQGPDTGPSYRSAIFPQNAQQSQVARAYIVQLSQAKSFARPIATKLESGEFFLAEAYHQDFARNNPRHPYIVQWDIPKLKATRAAFANLVR